VIKNKREVRSELRKKQNKKCFYCGGSFSHGSHIDHIIPRCHNGSNNIRNLCLACPRCNTYKSGCSLRRWLNKLEEKDRRGRYVNWKKWNDQRRINVIRKLVSLTGIETKEAEKQRKKAPIRASEPAMPVQPVGASTIHNLMKGLSTDRP